MWYTDGRDNKKISFSMQPNAKKAVFITRWLVPKGDDSEIARQIIELFWRRNEQAISETDRKYGAYCRQISQNILANESDSEENLNDTYLQAWHSIPPQKPACLLAYLGRIAGIWRSTDTKPANPKNAAGTLLSRWRNWIFAHRRG